MATSSAPRPAREAGHRAREEEGSGWVTFAGVMLVVLGTMNIIYGIAAIDDSRFYARDVTYIFGGLNTWGWFMLGIGALQIGAAFSVFNGSVWGPVVGIVCASLNLIVQMLVIPAAPLLAISLIAIDILVIYGLVSYGGQGRDA